jgi:hypothetical protein
MQRFAKCIAGVVLATVSLLAGRISAAAGNPCSNSAFHSSSPVREGSTWRMEVLVDEAAYSGPSIHDRLNHHWSQTAKRTYRWTSTTMPIDAGTSTQLMAISAAVIGKGMPPLERGDIVDVAIASQLVDYNQGRAPVILRRVCGGRDERCIDGLRKKQEGKDSGVEIGGGYSVGGNRKLWPPLANRSRSALRGGCRVEMTAASR